MVGHKKRDQMGVRKFGWAHDGYLYTENLDKAIRGNQSWLQSFEARCNCFSNNRSIAQARDLSCRRR